MKSMTISPEKKEQIIEVAGLIGEAFGKLVGSLIATAIIARFPQKLSEEMISLPNFTNKMTLSNEQLAALTEAYAEMIVDGMDMDDLITFAVESLVAEYNKYTEAELLSEIEELYDEEVLNDLIESVVE
jgi:large-conductance mechanosensitive channel